MPCVVALATGSDRFVVQRAEIAQVVGDHGAVLSPGQGQHLRVRQSLAIRMPGDGFGVVPACPQFAGQMPG